MRDAVATVIDASSTSIIFDIEALELTFDQMSVITMLVIEFANNAQKHVFESNSGRRFLVSLRALPDDRAVLSVRDDGPGWNQTDGDVTERTLGRTIMLGLAGQLGGRLSIKSENGTEVSVVFPTSVRGEVPAATAGDRSLRPAMHPIR